MPFKNQHVSMVSFSVELRGTDVANFMVVETSLHLNPRHPQYDHAAVSRLIEAAHHYLDTSGNGSMGMRLVSNRGGQP
jgi:hypothetical protein